MWNLPRPGIESMSPALAGGFLTTRPPGKSWVGVFRGKRPVTYMLIGLVSSMEFYLFFSFFSPPPLLL